jgi:TolB-like protein/Flp pilus assembly protein TadD
MLRKAQGRSEKNEMAEAGDDERPASAPSGAPEVFVSYASPDSAVADEIVATLERQGVKCWIAPRDVTPGAHYADSIMSGINGAKALVLVLSDAALLSAHVGKEVERASSKGRPIIAVRTGTAPLPPAYEYFLSESQWIEVGTGGVSAVARKLVEAVRFHLDPAGAGESRVPSQLSFPRHAAARPRKRWAWAAVAAAALLVGGMATLMVNDTWRSTILARMHPAATAISAKSIAVLPFADMSEGRNQEYFADGMAEEIIDLLASIPGLSVVGRTSSFQFKGKSDDLRAIGESLGAAYVVEGSVRTSGARIRVTAQLIDTRTGTHRWSQSYDRNVGDVLALENDIATNIARTLQLAVAADDLRPVRQLPSAEAYTLYLRSRSALDRLDESLMNAPADLEQALELDASFVQAAEALALVHAELAVNSGAPSTVAWGLAKEAAQKALRLDPHSVRAHAVLGLALAEQEFRWDEADRELEAALSRNPRDSLVLEFAARVACHRGRYDDAMRRINTALALDPLNSYLYNTKGVIEFLGGDLQGAERTLRRVIALSPTFGGVRVVLAWVLLARGKPEVALRELSSEPAPPARDSGLASVYHSLGRATDSNMALERVKNEYTNWPFGVAVAHASRGEGDATIEWLERAYEVRDPDLLMFGPAHPFFAFLRDDPRYRAVLRKMNLPG